MGVPREYASFAIPLGATTKMDGCACDGVVWSQRNHAQHGAGISIDLFHLRDVDGGTLVVDEVDAGVGGRAAVEIGRRLARLATSNQVIVVTHLPMVCR